MGDIIYLREVPLQEPFHQLNFVTVLLLHFPKFINVYTYDIYYLHTIYTKHNRLQIKSTNFNWLYLNKMKVFAALILKAYQAMKNLILNQI